MIEKLELVSMVFLSITELFAYATILIYFCNMINTDQWLAVSAIIVITWNMRLTQTDRVVDYLKAKQTKEET